MEDAPKRRHNQSIQPYFFTLHVLSFVASVVLVAFITLCCFEEKSIQANHTRQGFILFHMSHQASVRTYFGDSARDDVHVLIVVPCFAKKSVIYVDLSKP
jgi:hypothetical protein